MRERVVSVSVCAVAVLCSLSGKALATTEGPSFFDARSVAMGSTGVAHVHNGASLYHNAATLHEIENVAVTLDVSPVIPVFTTPFTGPNTSVKSDANIAPFFLLGGAYRLNERLVLGLGFFGAGGFGGSYGDLGEVTLGQLEIAPALAFAVTKQLSIAAEYRVSYLFQHSKVLLGPPGGPTATADQHGTNFLGAHLGIYYRPIQRLRLGFVYRSKVTTSLSGEFESPLGTMDIESKFSSPHQFKFGVAYDVIEDKLLIAADVRYLLHAEANKEIDIYVKDGPLLQRQILNWDNAVVFGFGAEYNVTPQVPVRAGYSLTKSATPEDNPGSYYVPPGLTHGIHAGAGVRFSNVDLDLGGYYAFGSKDTTLPTNPGNAPPYSGTYKLDLYTVALSATYHH